MVFPRSHGQEAELMKPFKVKFLEVGPAFLSGEKTSFLRVGKT